MTSESFTRLYHEHYGLLFYWLLTKCESREAAEDLAAESFTLAWNSRDQLRDLSRFRSWVYAIAANQLKRHYAHRRCDISLDDADTQEIQEPGDFASALAKYEYVKKLLQKIPKNEPTKALLRFARGVPVKRIARNARIPVATVLTRIHKGRVYARRAARFLERGTYAYAMPAMPVQK